MVTYVLQIPSSPNATLTFTLQSDKDETPHVDIFLSSVKSNYSPQRMLHKLYINKVKHSFNYKMPNIKKNYFLRFDPSKRKGIFTLNNVKVHKNIWFSRQTYTVPLQNIKAMQHIAVISQNDSLQFKVTDNDPQFEIELKKNLKNLTYQKTSFFYRPYLDKFLISLLFTIVLFIVFRIFREIVRSKSLHLALKLFLYSAVFIFAIVKTSHYINTVVAFHPPDEGQHLAYVKYLHQNNSIVIPRFEEMRNLKDTRYNYLSHPPLYYHILNFAFDKDVTTNMNLPLFRHISRLIFLFSFLLLLYIGWQVKFRPIGDVVYLSIISSVPLFAYLGASINNDNLAFLGAALFFVSFFNLVKKKYTNTTYFILGLSLFIAYFAKLTVVIFIFISLVFYLFYLFYKREMIKISVLQVFILACFSIPILYYQWHIYTYYHTLMPGFNITNPTEFLNSSYYVDESKRIYLSAYEWFLKMSSFSFVGWFNIQSHHHFFKSNWMDYIGAVSIQLFAVLSLFCKCEEKYKTVCIVGKITLLAFISVFIIQYFFTYSNHIKYGYMGGTQSRYLLPFLASIALMSAIFANRYSKNIWSYTFIALLCLHAIYSDFFYFLLYYK